MEEVIDEIPAGVNTLQLKNEEEKAQEILDGDENSLLVIKELKNLDQNKVHFTTSSLKICISRLFNES